MKPFFFALQFLTILPFKIKGRIKARDFGQSLLYFPLVGLIIGGILAGLVYIFHPGSPLIIAILIILISTLLTGGLHLDGFADTCDGLYGRQPLEKRLEIMRDSHLGVMGVIGLVCLLLLKFSLLAHIPYASLGKAVIMMAVISRWSQVIACYDLRYLRKEGKARFFVEQARWQQVVISGLPVFFLVIFLARLKGLVVLLGTLLAAAVFIRYVRRKIGGATGDTIGAVNEIAEAASLLLAALVYGVSG